MRRRVWTLPSTFATVWKTALEHAVCFLKWKDQRPRNENKKKKNNKKEIKTSQKKEKVKKKDKLEGRPKRTKQVRKPRQPRNCPRSLHTRRKRVSRRPQGIVKTIMTSSEAHLAMTYTRSAPALGGLFLVGSSGPTLFWAHTDCERAQFVQNPIGFFIPLSDIKKNTRTHTSRTLLVYTPYFRGFFELFVISCRVKSKKHVFWPTASHLRGRSLPHTCDWNLGRLRN